MDLGGLSGGELLDHVDVLARRQRETEVEILVAARQHAVLNGPETIPPWQLNVPGGERPRRFGGLGTPLVAEFSPATFAAGLGVSTYAARELMADALDLDHRLPRLWERVRTLEVKVSYARLVARKTRDLTKEQADHVDERVAESADGRISWARFELLVEAAVKAADPVAAREREEAEAQRQFAEPTGSTEDGMRGFYIRGPFATIAKLDAAVAYFAQVLQDLGDTGSLDRRRVKAVLILANPVHAVDLVRAYQQWLATQGDPRPEVDWSVFMPAVVVYVHLYGGADSEGIARVEGHGPLTEAWVREHLGPHARFTITPVLDIEGQAPVDAYEVPDRHRQAVHLMMPADTFPFSNSLSRSQQIDHTIAFAHGGAARGAGQSRVGNYGKLTVLHHRIKTFAGWQVRQPFPGVYVWRDPYGALYLVDHTGTRRLGVESEAA
jgi:Domain of unknown function (DUF222)